VLTQSTVFHDHRQAEIWHTALKGYAVMYTEGYEFRPVTFDGQLLIFPVSRQGGAFSLEVMDMSLLESHSGLV